MRPIFFGILSLLYSQLTFSQGCCSGGGGNPIAGGATLGVLDKDQAEIAFSNQYSESSRFLTGDSPSLPYFEKLNSNYLFLRMDYGVTSKLSLSTAMGYYTNRTIYEFRDTATNDQRLISSKGFGDLFIIPRYNIYSGGGDKVKSELTAGIGLKIPIGKPNDSTFIGHSYFLNFDNGTPFIDSNEIWQTAPPTVQRTTGSNDFIFQLLYLNSFKRSDFKLYVNGMYMKRGWNSLGIRFGDYASVSLIAGKSFFKKFSLLGQLRGEWAGKIYTHDKVDYLAQYNIDTASTGALSAYFTPQINFFVHRSLTLFMLADIPMYQKVNGTQVANPYQFTAGISFRFYPDPKDRICEVPANNSPQRSDSELVTATFTVWGKCGMCKDKIEQTTRAMPGVAKAKWNLERMELQVTYDEKGITQDQIKERLAEVGYDSATHRAKQEVYDALPLCCKYERPK